MCQSLFLHLRRALLVPHSAVVLFWISLLLTMTIHAPFVNAKPRVEDVVAEFINPNFFHGKYPFEKMVIDPSTGRVYVGGVNNLYDIYSDTASLIVKAHAITGPEEDSKECPSRVPCMSAVRKTLHDSYTKGLAVYERNSKLIECSSLFQGRCRWRNLYNIDQREVIKESQQHIVANDNSSSTVIFVGTGTSADGTPSDVLYVASTYVPSGGPFRDDVPAVASRSLDQNHLFDVSVQGVGTGTEIRMHSGYREKYKIDYIGGFQSGKFAYFATRQSKHEDPEVSWFISKLVRVCTGDSHFWSYTEVPLECRKGEENFNLVTDVYLSKPGFNLASALRISTEEDVLYAVFVKGTGRKKDQLTSESALCVYPISQIEQVFLKNIELCFKGEVSKNLPWFTQSDRCSPTKYSSQEVICGKDVNSYIGGEAPIEVEPLLITKDAQFSAVATNTTRGSTVAFIGTHDGKLLKAVIENETSSFIYRSFDVGGGYPVLQDLELDGTGDHVFVLSPFSLSKIKVRQCGDASDCITCLNQRDPYCGWCILNNACVPEGECTKSIPSTQHDWLTYSSGRCPAIRSVDPDKMQITSAYYLNIELENLPITDGKLTCIFDFGNLSSPLTMFAEQDSDGEMRIRCPTPSLMRLPKIPPGLQSISAKLAISNSADGPPLASTTFTFYDCSSFSSCTSCVNSSFPCDWCIESDRCVAGIITESRCRSEHVINGVVRNVPQHRKGPDFCPHIVSTEPTIYVMSGKSQKISVHVKNAMDLMTDFKCQFKVEHSVHERLASKEGDVILCEIMKFEYFGQGFGNGTEIANFSVMWSSEGEQGGGHVLDNINNIHIVMYKCEMLASNCGMCLVVGSKEFDCGWCSNERKCLPQEKCPAVPNSEWLDRSKLCPNPVILDFNPKKGPIRGGTTIVIDGVNLGNNYHDVSSAVTVANVRCNVDAKAYVTSSRIVCRTRASPVQKMARNPIIVKLRDEHRYTAISNDTFMYVDPTVSRMKPQQGPQFGGTDVTIFGENLDAGSSVTVTIKDIPCRIRERTSERLVCRTGRSSEEGYGNLKIDFDGSAFPYNDLTFEYHKNPQFTAAEPERSIASGGIAVHVAGTGLSLLQRPHMVVMDEGRLIKGPQCEIENDNLMHCKTPDLNIPPDRMSHPTMEHPLKLLYGFELDGVGPENTSQMSNTRTLSIYPDPLVERFPDVKFYRPDDYLTINGKNLDAAASELDVSVTVGGVTCNVTALASRALTCLPPPERPPRDLMSSNDDDPDVVVEIGGMRFNVGKLSYNTKGFGISRQVMIAITIAVVAFILAFLLLLVLYRRKSTSHMREMKYLKNQMDAIEMKVASECKEAFAELQTSMDALAADLPLGTPFIPFLSYKEYAARVLFSNNYYNHPVLRDLEVDSNRAASIETGLRAFNKLLMNKHFLLSFVRALENTRYFLSKDRVYVGSLLMVVLQEKMEYCTEILKQLLKELIDRTVEKKFQPKILFRRSESVAERMLAAWFTFLMHRYLTECAGYKLYALYWAIKQQMEKGPQDALTLDARYSLSEEKLLRSSIEFHEMTVFIAADHHSSSAMEYPVRVLDCDTITQVKEKCLDAKYRIIPYSERPSAYDLDLELRSTSPRLILQDIDNTSKVEAGGWKRLNTLAHYKVLDNATLALLPRQTSLYNLSLLSERSERSTFSLSKNSPTLPRPFGTNSSSQSKGLLSNNEPVHKLYHLVKPSEHGPSDQQDKMVTEIYLTRLLTMKGTLQKFIQDLLEVIFSTSGRNCSLPLCVKYMFDFMDEQAQQQGIDDQEVVHAWKSNSLPLRFWVNLIKNPHFVFDIPKPTKVEGCLSVVAQTLMDACSTQDQQLTKDSPSSKLLFAKDIYQYRDWVDSYYAEIKEMPAVSDQDMNALLAEESRAHSRDRFQVFSALNELYKYVEQYREPIREELEMNEYAVNQKLPQKFQEMLNTMECLSDNYNIGVASPPLVDYSSHGMYRQPREDRV